MGVIVKRAVLSALVLGLVALGACTAVPIVQAPGQTPASTVPAATAGPAARPTATAVPSPTPPPTPAAVVTAWNTASPTPLVPTPSATVAPIRTAVASGSGSPTLPAGFATYSDREAGFALDYPSNWVLTAPSPEAKRQAAVYSASFRSPSPVTPRPIGQDMPPGASGLDVTVVNAKVASFDAMVRQRRNEISQSEMPVRIVSEETWTLAGGLPALRWQLVSQMGGTVAELVTVIDGRRVLLAGMGDLTHFDTIARSLRPLGEASAPSATPAATPSLPAGWQAYTDASLGFTFAHPSTWALCQDSGQSRLFCQRKPAPSGPAFPRFWVTVMPQGFTNQDFSAYDFLPEGDVKALAALDIGGSRATDARPEYSTFVRLPDTTVDGRPAVVIENSRVWEGGPDTKDRRALVTVGTTTYMLGTYYGTAGELADFQQVLAGFRIAGR